MQNKRDEDIHIIDAAKIVRELANEVPGLEARIDEANKRAATLIGLGFKDEGFNPTEFKLEYYNRLAIANQFEKRFGITGVAVDDMGLVRLYFQLENLPGKDDFYNASVEIEKMGGKLKREVDSGLESSGRLLANIVLEEETLEPVSVPKKFLNMTFGTKVKKMPKSQMYNISIIVNYEPGNVMSSNPNKFPLLKDRMPGPHYAYLAVAELCVPVKQIESLPPTLKDSEMGFPYVASISGVIYTLAGMYGFKPQPLQKGEVFRLLKP